MTTPSKKDPRARLAQAEAALAESRRQEEKMAAALDEIRRVIARARESSESYAMRSRAFVKPSRVSVKR